MQVNLHGIRALEGVQHEASLLGLLENGKAVCMGNAAATNRNATLINPSKQCTGLLRKQFHAAA